MIDSDISLALDNPSWIQVLRAYHAAQQEPEQSGDSSPQQSAIGTEQEEVEDSGDVEEGAKARRGARWLSRIHQFEGLAREELSRIHGRLIAYGFLKCDLSDRTAEVVYQVTLAGKQLIGLASNILTPEIVEQAEVAAAA